MINRSNLITYLVKSGRNFVSQPRDSIDFTGDRSVDGVMNDLENNPHLFVLGMQMDRGIEQTLAWGIPYRIREVLDLKGFDFQSLREPSIEELVQVFIGHTLHRYPAKMARIFHNTLEHIENAYDGEATHIWNDHPSSATLIKRFLQFDGMSLRLASRAANRLYRDFKVELSDASSLDITPEYYIRRVFMRAGFIGRHASDEELIYCARELHLRYPAIFDKPCAEIVDTVCRAEKPECARCPLETACMKYY